MKKIFITGAEGFVGQHAVNILKKDYSIVGLSRSTPLESEENVEYIIGDILDPNAIEKILAQHNPDVILHLAGIAKTWNNDLKEVFNINLFGTLNIYQAIINIKEKKDYNPKIIFVSSAEVYGKTQDTKSITEEMLLFPISEYGSSKASADRASFQFSQTHGLNIVILRPFPHIGPGQKGGFFVPDMASQIIEIENDPQKHELMVGNLQSVRDYLDVRDVIQAYKLAIETNLPKGEVFNICSGNGVKVEDLLKKLLSLTNKKIAVVQDPSKLRAVDLPVFVGNNHKFAEATGWKPEYSLDQSLEDVMNYWRETTQ